MKTSKSRRGGMIALVGPLLVLGSVPALAQEPTNQELAERVTELEEIVFELTSEGDGFGMTANYEDVTAAFQIFGDVGFSYHEPEVVDNDHTDFAFGSLDFVVNVGFGPHWRGLSETVIDGKSNDSISFSQERLWISWVPSDELYVKFGTEHSPIMRWNQLYHHGHWLEPTITRPLVVSFEGGQGILPMHRTGVTVGGSVTNESLRFEYYGTVSNGRGEAPSDKQRTEDADDHKAVDLGIAVEPAFAHGLRIGASVVKDEIPVDPASVDPLRARSISEEIATAYVETPVLGAQVVAEFALIRHEANATGEMFDSNAGYVQATYDMGGWTPYLRFDYRNMEEGDPFYSPLGRDLDVQAQYLGVRWDLHSNVAVKVEVGIGEADEAGPGGITSDDFAEGRVQVSWWL